MPFARDGDRIRCTWFGIRQYPRIVTPDSSHVAQPTRDTPGDHCRIRTPAGAHCRAASHGGAPPVPLLSANVPCSESHKKGLRFSEKLGNVPSDPGFHRWMMPRWMAAVAACVRSCTPSLLRMFLT